MTPSNRGSQPNKRPGQSSRRLPAHVYRRRRLTLAALSLVVIAMLVLGVVGIVKAVEARSEAEATAAKASATQTPTPTAPVPDAESASGKCPTDKVGVSGRVDKKSFKEDDKPKFELVISNQNDATCLIEVGTKHQEFIVEQDGDVVWSSKYCAADDDENAEVATEFAPESEKVAQFEWNRVRVDKNCNKTDKAFEPGKYELIVKLEDKESKSVAFELEKDEATKAKEKKEAEEKKAKEEAKEKAEKEKADKEKESSKADSEG